MILYAQVFPRLEVVKSYRLKASNQGSLTVVDDLTAAGVDKEVCFSWLLKNAFVMFLNISEANDLWDCVVTRWSCWLDLFNSFCECTNV